MHLYLSLSGNLFLETPVEELKQDKETNRFVSREQAREQASKREFMLSKVVASAWEGVYDGE